MLSKHKKVCATLYYIEHFLILASAIRCISFSCFAFLLDLLTGIKSCAIELKTFAIPTAIKNYKSIIKYDKVVLLAKSKFNNIEVLIFKD